MRACTHMRQFRWWRHHSWRKFGSNRIDNGWDITFNKCDNWPTLSRSADVTLLLPARVVSFWWKFGYNRLYNSCRHIINVVNGGDLDLLFEAQLTCLFLLARAPSFLSKFGKNRSYISWNTAIFVNWNFDLHFQDQMIRYFIAVLDAVIVVIFV